MADKKHLVRLKEGVENWNSWRLSNPSVRPSLAGADLTRLDLSGANLVRSNLAGANLASISLVKSNLSDAILSGANLSGAVLRQTDFTGADLSRAHFDRAEFSATVLVRTCLLGVTGLKSALYLLPSHIDHWTLEQSVSLPEIFLLGCGFSDSDLKAYTDRLEDSYNTSYFTCFLSYAGRDKHLARAIYSGLTASGVDCFFAEEDVRVGDNLTRSILPEIEKRDRVIVLVSSASMTRYWVTAEVARALLIKIKRGNQNMILPVYVGRISSKVKSWWATLVTEDLAYVRLARHPSRQEVDQTVGELLRVLKKH